jgi:hypothetical protein
MFTFLFCSYDWMEKRILKDLSPFQNGFCQKCMLDFFEKNKDPYLLCKFTIKSNKVLFNTPHSNNPRFTIIYSALNELAQRFSLPDVTFIVTIHDALDISPSFPLFVMSKSINSSEVLFPDFEALASTYQVIQNINLETTDFPIRWENRKNLLIWRGSGAQRTITPENMNQKSRVILCQLGEQYPELIDAGFTFFIPDCIKKYQKSFLSYPTLFSYKYQIWLDGNTASYSNSGWRLYSGSTIFKEDSPFIQWYYDELEQWIHYVPVKNNLEDLIDKLLLLQENALLAKQIALNAVQFARDHITKKNNLEYLYKLLWAYSSCHNITHLCP